LPRCSSEAEAATSLFDDLGAIWFYMLAIDHQICKREWEAYHCGVSGDCRHV
jgi:hypothetical protein